MIYEKYSSITRNICYSNHNYNYNKKKKKNGTRKITLFVRIESSFIKIKFKSHHRLIIESLGEAKREKKNKK